MSDDNAEGVERSSDGYRTAVIDRCFIVAWSNVTTQATNRVIAEFRKAHERHGDLAYIAVIPESMPPPDADGREALSTAVKVLLPVCSSMHVVIEGAGFRKAMHRAAASFFMLAGQRGKMKVHDTFLDALRGAGLDATAASGVLARARLQKLIP